MGTCPGCSHKVRAIKQLSLWKLPQILMVSLKRLEWVFEPPNFRVRKLSCLVDFPLQGLNLSQFVAPEAPQKFPLVYDVTAIVDHIGSLADDGHYTASCRRPDGWFLFDDSLALPLPPDCSIVNRQNYILFLERHGASHAPEAIPEQRASRPHAWPHVIDFGWSFPTGSEG